MRRWRPIIDDAVSAARFSGRALADALVPALAQSDPTKEPLGELYAALPQAAAEKTLMGAVRAAFLIEPVNAAITSTKFERRWATRPGEQDPRFSPFEECAEIFCRLLEELAAALEQEGNRDLLRRFARFATIPYEVPVDYDERDGGHRPGNLGWLFADREIAQTLLLRELVSDPHRVGELRGVFALAGKKARVKTYLTDRALTGAHQTNREKRWEAHPGGVQFAFRRDCLKIEHKLLSQVCHFEGFPGEVRERLAGEGAILSTELPARCPITRDALRFELLAESLQAPRWGRSAFQVGHLNPLKGPGSGPEFGHTPANVAWLTADGNRIQGDLSYRETVSLLERIQENRARFPAPR